MALDDGVRVDFSKSEIVKFSGDINRFVRQFGEGSFEKIMRSAVRRIVLKEARGILAQEAQDGSGSLEDKGLLVTKEKGSDEASILLGGGRAKRNIHGFLTHWVELGTSGVVRDGGDRYKKGTRYRAPTKGIHFLERSASTTKDTVFKSITKTMDKRFRNLG